MKTVRSTGNLHLLTEVAKEAGRYLRSPFSGGVYSNWFGGLQRSCEFNVAYCGPQVSRTNLISLQLLQFWPAVIGGEADVEQVAVTPKLQKRGTPRTISGCDAVVARCVRKKVVRVFRIPHGDHI